MTEKRYRCPWCGGTVLLDGRVCYGCGRTVRRNEGVAAVLSLVMPGLGQVYVGRLGVGILQILVAAAVFLIGLVVPVLWVVLLLLSIWSAHDAYETARKINRGERV